MTRRRDQCRRSTAKWPREEEGPRAPIPPTLARTKRPMLFLAEADVGVRAFFPPPTVESPLNLI